MNEGSRPVTAPGSLVDAPAVVVLDLDGVLRHWDPAIIRTAETGARLPAGSLAAVAFGDADLLRAAVTGAITDEEWRASITGRLGDQFGQDAAMDAVAAWSAPAGEVVPEVLVLVREVRGRVPVALFSNATSRLPRDLESLGLTGEVDVVLNSADLGLAKPDPAAFRAAALRLGREAEECLFVDDTAANVVGAESAGMSAHHFTTAAGLRAVLAELGLAERQAT
jgi:HAD superfamily hydrolase (TIGR01509 family)